MFEKSCWVGALPVDVTTGVSRSELEHELRVTQQMFKAAFYAAAIGKAIVAVTGHCIEVNPSLANLLGYPRESLAGVHFSEFTHPADIETDLELFNAVMRGERDSYQLEKRYLHRNGATLDVLLSATVIREADGTPIQFISEIVDLTERKRVRRELQAANEKLKEQVVRDHLTGLLNRRGFEAALAAPVQMRSVTVLLIDLDDFKGVNDRLGHFAGDIVLEEVGRRLPQLLREGDVVGRVGGDEFGIILHDSNRQAGQRVAQDIVHGLGRPYEIHGKLVDVGASVGGACDTAGALGLRSLMSRADAALYLAKRAGRGTWRWAEKEAPTLLPSA
jgi:diguanylate cyclase (GGDEF)-like protein/PAS domain S-box-containing protein